MFANKTLKSSDVSRAGMIVYVPGAAARRLVWVSRTGVEEPVVSLATMMNDGRVHLSTAWWVATFPGLMLMLLILGVNFLGDGLADRFNPKFRRGGFRLV